MANVKVPKLPTIRRLPTYLYKLSEMRKAGISIVATPELARYMNLGEIVIRKDLAITGVTGQPGVGYKVKELIDAIKSYLNWTTPPKRCWSEPVRSAARSWATKGSRSTG